MRTPLIGFIKKELSQALRDVRMRFLLFGVPIVQMTVFGLALSMEVRNIRLAVQSRPGDRLMRQVAERAVASGWFLPVDPRGEDPFVLIRSGRAEAVLIAPPEGEPLQLLVDAANTVRAQGVARYVRAIVAEVAAAEAGRPPAEPAVQLQVRTLFNPALRSPVFLVPGVMCMILCVTTLMMTAMSLAREKELGTFEMLVAAPVGTIEILLGKTVPYVLLGLINVPLIVGVAVLGFQVPFLGSWWELFLASLLFLSATVAIGLAISTFARDQQQAMMGSFLFLFPAVLLSGIIFPLDNVPPGLYELTWLNPLRYFVVLLRNILLKGGDPIALASNLIPLALLTAAAVTVSIRRFHRTLN